jgi:hypothetical protein
MCGPPMVSRDAEVELRIPVPHVYSTVNGRACERLRVCGDSGLRTVGRINLPD